MVSYAIVTKLLIPYGIDNIHLHIVLMKILPEFMGYLLIAISMPYIIRLMEIYSIYKTYQKYGDIMKVSHTNNANTSSTSTSQSNNTAQQQQDQQQDQQTQNNTQSKSRQEAQVPPLSTCNHGEN